MAVADCTRQGPEPGAHDSSESAWLALAAQLTSLTAMWNSSDSDEAFLVRHRQPEEQLDAKPAAGGGGGLWI